MYLYQWASPEGQPMNRLTYTGLLGPHSKDHLEAFEIQKLPLQQLALQRVLR